MPVVELASVGPICISLEGSNERLVTLVQMICFGPIYISLAGTNEHLVTENNDNNDNNNNPLTITFWSNVLSR